MFGSPYLWWLGRFLRITVSEILKSTMFRWLLLALRLSSFFNWFLQTTIIVWCTLLKISTIHTNQMNEKNRSYPEISNVGPSHSRCKSLLSLLYLLNTLLHIGHQSIMMGLMELAFQRGNSSGHEHQAIRQSTPNALTNSMQRETGQHSKTGGLGKVSPIKWHWAKGWGDKQDSAETSRAKGLW